MKRGFFRSVCAHLRPERGWQAEKGQALPIVLAALALGVMVVAPFLNHASSSLISSRSYRQMLCEQYSAGAGVEEALWRLANSELAGDIPGVNDQTAYTLAGKINGITPLITVTRLSSRSQDAQNPAGRDSFRIESLAGSTTVTAAVTLNSGAVKVDAWQIKN